MLEWYTYTEKIQPQELIPSSGLILSKRSLNMRSEFFIRQLLWCLYG